MTAQEQEILMMYNTLPETEQGLAYELLRRLVLAWDPDFTKLTPSERTDLEESERDLKEGHTVRMEDIDWDCRTARTNKNRPPCYQHDER